MLKLPECQRFIVPARIVFSFTPRIGMNRRTYMSSAIKTRQSFGCNPLPFNPVPDSEEVS